jgi:glycosyltransferase involved in cell wall biosynthesis
MRMVANLVDRFNDRYDFFVVTRNYDSRSNRVPFDVVKTNEWNTHGGARVFYAADDMWSRRFCKRLYDEIRPDIALLNSMFSTPAVNFMLARWSGKAEFSPVVIAPCGNLSTAALRNKSLRKRAFLLLAKAIGLYSKVIWKASTSVEKKEIESCFGINASIMVAPDLPGKEAVKPSGPDVRPQKISGSVRLAFVARVVRIKNLLYLLQALDPVRTGVVYLTIIGPVEDREYWQKCLRLIGDLPPNITVEVTGGVSPSVVMEHLRRTHFLAHATLNENFGYVVLESLTVGTPVVLSDQVGWQGIDEMSAGFVLPLTDKNKWTETILRCLEMHGTEFENMSRAASEYARAFVDDPALDEATENLLRTALHDGAKDGSLLGPSRSEI